MTKYNEQVKILVIKDFVAKEIEEYKKDGLSLLTLMEERGINPKFEDWLVSDKIKNSEIVALAWLYDYTIEEELFVLVNKKTKRYLFTINEDGVEEKYTEYNDIFENNNLKSKFTDSQIKKMVDIEGYIQKPLSEVE